MCGYLISVTMNKVGLEKYMCECSHEWRCMRVHHLLRTRGNRESRPPAQNDSLTIGDCSRKQLVRGQLYLLDAYYHMLSLTF